MTAIDAANFSNVFFMKHVRQSVFSAGRRVDTHVFLPSTSLADRHVAPAYEDLYRTETEQKKIRCLAWLYVDLLQSHQQSNPRPNIKSI